MPALYRILGYLILFGIFVTVSIFFFWVFALGVVITSLYGIYRYSMTKFKSKRPKHVNTNQTNQNYSQPYRPGEVIDMPIEYTDKKD